MEEKYFAAANSGEGFVSYFGEVFRPEEFQQIYIIKGGPGTGKSYFMRQVAEAAERQGENVVYWYCSSDPDSLDGITVGRMTRAIHRSCFWPCEMEGSFSSITV